MGRNTASSKSRNQKRKVCQHSRRYVGAAALFLTSMTLHSVVSAQPFEYGADIYSALTYTNNVGLDTSDREDGESIFEISPRFTATRDGQSVDVNFDYRLQALFYGEESDRNEIYNYLQAGMSAQVIPDFFYIDANGSISQALVDPSLQSSFSSASGAGNRTEVGSYSVSPYFRRNLAPYTVARAGVSLGLVEYAETRLVDNDELEYFASITNQGGAGSFNWSADFNSRDIDYDIGQQIKLSRVSGEVGYRIGPRTELVVSGGEDSNDFDNLPGNSVAEGSFWEVGFRGGIGNNINYDVRGGEQFFGDSYSVSFDRQAKALTTTLSYTEAATTVGAQQLDAVSALSLLTGINTQDIQNFADVTGIELPRLDPEFYIRKRFDFSNTISGGKSTLRGAVYYEDRTFIRTNTPGGKEQLLGARLDWSWEYDDITTITANINYQDLKTRDGISEPKDLRLGVNARRSVLTSSYVVLRGYINTRSSSGARAEYDEYAITLGFGYQF